MSTPTGIVAESGPFSIVVETRLDRIQEFWALSYAVVVVEFGARRVRFWPIEHHADSIYLVAYEQEFMVGGVRLLRPLPEGFFTHGHFDSTASVPSAHTLRSLGRVGEAASLVLIPRARGRIGLDICHQAIRTVARSAGLTHLIANAVIPWRVPALYSFFGFQPYALPQIDVDLRRSSDDRRPNVVPMITAIADGAPMPVNPMPCSIADLERMSDQYLASD